MNRPPTRPLWSALLAACVAPTVLYAQDDFDRAPIAYSQTAPDNAISRLQQRLQLREARLQYEEPWGYLRSLLQELDVPVSSQTLVFSKTSLQRSRIAPRTPRALYFNDDIYIGYCRHGEVLEVSVADPQLGTVFYTLDQDPDGGLEFQRHTDNCLLCHGGTQTRGVPGHMVRSVYPDGTGQPILASGTYRIDHTSPLERRWGGWYVTGKHGDQKHLGNRIYRSREDVETGDDAAHLNVTDLGNRIDRKGYLAPHSDLIALMVLEHQAGAHNALTRASFDTRMALHREEALNRELGEPAGHRWESTGTILKNSAEQLLKYFLFVDEIRLQAPLEGTSSFTAEFPQAGPRDKQGRSLRDFDLQTRLFRYPCSYLIYTDSFAALPAELRERFWTRLDAVLSGADRSPEFAHLSAADRQSIREILAATHPGAPAAWSSEVKPAVEVGGDAP